MGGHGDAKRCAARRGGDAQWRVRARIDAVGVVTASALLALLACGRATSGEEHRSGGDGDQVETGGTRTTASGGRTASGGSSDGGDTAHASGGTPSPACQARATAWTFDDNPPCELSDGYARSFPVVVESGPTTVVVVAHVERLEFTQPLLELRVDSTLIGSLAVGSSVPSTYSFSFAAQAGQHDIGVSQRREPGAPSASIVLDSLEVHECAALQFCEGSYRAPAATRRFGSSAPTCRVKTGPRSRGNQAIQRQRDVRLRPGERAALVAAFA